MNQTIEMQLVRVTKGAALYENVTKSDSDDQLVTNLYLRKKPLGMPIPERISITVDTESARAGGD